MDIDFLQGNFDLKTLKILSGSKADVPVPLKGTPVFIAGKAVPLFNAYDALEMALRDELLSAVSDQKMVNYVCELIMDDFSNAVEEALEPSDLQNWLTAANLTAACMMEFVLPKKLVWRLSLRLRNCFRKICTLSGSEEIWIS